MPEKESKGIKKFFEEFKAFAMRGNVLDMAVGLVIGGAYTYREALPRISEAYLTEIDQDFDGDTFFTMTDPAAWNIEEVGTFEDGGCTGRFTHWVRK